MKKSENFGFSLPENSDNCSLDYFNDNFKLIDKNLKQALNPPSSIVLDSIEIKNNNGGTIITCDGMRYYERNYDFEDLVLGTDSLDSNSKYYIKAINIQNPTSEQFGILSANLAVYEYEGEIKSVDDSFIFATFETDINALYVEDSLRYFPDSHIYEKINTKADKSYVNNKTAFSLGVPGFYGADNVLIKTFDKMIADGDVTVSDGILTAVSITEQGKLIISEDVTELAVGVFAGKSSLIGVKIPDTVTVLPSGAFHGTSLTSVIIPDSVTSIGNAAFGSCKSLKSVTLGKGVTRISDGSFDACSALTDVYFKGSKTEFDKIEIGMSNEYLKNATIHYELTDEVYDEIDKKADMSYVDENYSRAVKGIRTGTVLLLDDISLISNKVNLSCKSGSTPTVNIYNKNLLHFYDKDNPSTTGMALSGSTIKWSGSTNGTAISTRCMPYIYLPVGTYTFTVTVSGTISKKANLTIAFDCDRKTYYPVIEDFNNEVKTISTTFTVVNSGAWFLINAMYFDNHDVDMPTYDLTFAFQLEAGDTATEYEEYKEPQTITLDGNTQTVNVYTNTVITADSEIVVTYNRDTSKVINQLLIDNENLKNAVIALGGTI